MNELILKDGFFRRQWKRFTLFLALSLLLLFAVFQLLIKSDWFLGKIENRLELKTQLDWEIESISWNGFDDVSLAGLSATAEGGVGLTVDEMTLGIDWVDWKPVVQNCEMIRPKGVVTFDLLASLLSRESSPVVEVEPVPPSKNAPHLGQGSAPPPDGGEKPVRPDDGQVPSQPSKPVPPAPVPEIVNTMPQWLKVRGADVEVKRSVGEDALFAVKGLNLNMPMNGPEANGIIEWEEVEVDGKLFNEGGSVDLRWIPPYIELPKTSISLFGMNYDLYGKAFANRLMPMKLLLSAPRQSLEKMSLLNHRVEVEAEALEVGMSVGGLLMQPKTIDVKLAVNGTGMIVSDKEKDQVVDWHLVNIVAAANARGIFLPEFRLVGEELSLLGNAQATSSNELAGHFRIYADSTAVSYIAYHLDGTTLAEKGKRWFVRSETPERWRRDIHFVGEVTDPWVDAGPDGRWMKLQEAVDSIWSFFVSELKEEHINLDQPGGLRELMKGEKVAP